MRSMDWMDDARCSGQSAELFFADYDRFEADAAAFCRKCPVEAHCLAYAMEREQSTHRFGVWGGKTAKERGAQARRRRRAAAS